MFGTKGLKKKSELKKAYEFDEVIARAIGDNYAIVNLETNWDRSDCLELIKSEEGFRAMAKRVETYRRFAPKTILMSSGGMWRGDDEYRFFKRIDSLIDIRGGSLVVANKNPNCAAHADGSLWSYGQTVDEAVQKVVNIKQNQKRMEELWSNNKSIWITNDISITSCGWGESVQTDLINKIVSNLDCLFSEGWRGGFLRNIPSEQSTVGVLNERGFQWTSNQAAVELMKQGRNKILSILQNGASCSSKLTITNRGSTEWWIQLQITPNDSIRKVYVVTANQRRKLTLKGNDYSSNVSDKIPYGSTVTVEVTTDSGVEHTIQW